MIWNALEARLGWWLGEVVIVLVIIAPFAAALAVSAIKRRVKQSRCAHPSEYQSGPGGTDRRCSKCSKFLGYVWDKALPK